MLRSNIIRLGKHFASSSNHHMIKVTKFECRCLVSTKSVSEVRRSKRNVARGENITSFVRDANNISLDVEAVVSFVKANSISLNVSHDHFRENCKALLQFGFNTDTIIRFVEHYPDLFNIRSSELLRLLGLWMEVHFGEQLQIQLLSKHPQLIELIGPNVTERIRHLAPYFRNEKVVGNLFISSPSVIYENWDTLRAKLDFLHSHNIPMKNIANCSALELSILEIKTRFKFLERAGLYKQRIDLLKKDATHKNPTVRVILATSSKVLAENVAGLTLIEYEAFSELYAMENELLEEYYEEQVDEYDSE